jgi:hypothetical protein
MDRRTFIRVTGATSLGLAGRLGFAETNSLLRLLEDSPRERIPRELVARIRAGARYEDLLAALTLATVRNVQPYPDVGFKYHVVMMLRSINSTALHLPAAEKWLPLVWAADYFKDSQAQERAAGGWHQPAARAPAKVADSRRALIAALDHWDHDAADTAIVQYARAASPDQIFCVLFLYGARDLRAIGHKAIAVSNAYALTELLGGGSQAEPLLRSTVAAILNSDSDTSPDTHDFPADRPWRLNLQRVSQVPQSWKRGRDDPGARAELRSALYRTPPEDAGAVVVALLRRDISPDTIWQALFTTAAELLMLQPGIVPLHAQTTSNALHYAYRLCADERTQLILLLQCAAFVALFRQMTGAAESDLSLAALEPLAVAGARDEALREVFSELSRGQRRQAARKCLAYLQGGGDTDSVIATARHSLVLGAQEAHDFKLSEAVFENLAQFSDFPWRSRLLSAGMAFFTAPLQRPRPLVAETMELLRDYNP